MIKEIIKLTKPGIIFGNIVPCMAGFFLASGLQITNTFFYVILGAVFVIASGCTFNQIIDVKIDGKMKRTMNRPLVKKTITTKLAFICGVIFGIIGFGVLFFFTNLYSFFAGVIGFIFYVFFYSFSKPRTTLSVYIGSISGATTVFIGYFAYNPAFTLPVILFFLMMIVWQLPHSFAIHIFNAKDYKNAGVPTLLSKKGMDIIKLNIITYILLFILLNILFGIFATNNFLYLLASIPICLYWIFLFYKKEENAERWAKKIFFFSIVVVILLSILISFA